MPILIPINVNQKGSDLAVPAVRQGRFMSYLKALLLPQVWIQNVITNNYLAGAIYAAYNNSTVYTYGDRVTLPMLAGNASYEYINSIPSSGHLVSDADYWYQITSDNIGLTERLNYDGAKMQLEYILNRRFSPLTITPPFGSAGVTIYIVNNPTLPRIAWKGRNNALSSFRTTKAATSHWWHPSGNPSITGVNFTIMVPTAILAGLRPDPDDAKQMIITETKKYAIAGATFNVQSY